MDDHDIVEDSVIRMVGRLPGGSLSEEDIKATFSNIENQMQQLQNVLVNEQNRSTEFEKRLSKGTGRNDISGLRWAFRKGK